MPPLTPEDLLEQLSEQREQHEHDLRERDGRIRIEQERVQDLTRQVSELERDRRRAEEVKHERVELVERYRQVGSLIEQVICTCAGSQCPRCAALELLQG